MSSRSHFYKTVHQSLEKCTFKSNFKSVKSNLHGLDFPSVNFLLAEFIKNIHADTDTMSEIFIQQIIAEEQNQEDSIFTPNPLEFESLAEHQDVTLLFTEFPFEQTTTDSTIDFATDITTDVTTVFTADDIFDIKTDETINVTTGVTVGHTTDETTNVTNNVITMKPISSTVPQTQGVTSMLTENVETSPIRVSSTTSIHSTSSVPLISSSTTSSRLSSSSTLQSSLTKSSTAKTTTTIQPITIEINTWPSAVSTSITKETIKTSTKYSRKDACLNFCKATGDQ